MDEIKIHQLTDKQARFITEYLVDCNGTQAAIRAGYSESSARQIATVLLSNDYIKDPIQLELDQRTRNNGLTVDLVLNELKNAVKFNPKDLYNQDGSLKEITELDDSTSKVITGHRVVSVKRDDETKTTTKVTEIKWLDKLKSVEMAMKHLRILNEKVDVGVSLNDVLSAFPAEVQDQIKEAMVKKLNG